MPTLQSVTNTIYIHSKVFGLTEDGRELIYCIEKFQACDDFIDFRMHRSNVPSHVLLKQFGFKVSSIAGSDDVLQGQINLSKLKMSSARSSL
jgi:hypothetical protein